MFWVKHNTFSLIRSDVLYGDVSLLIISNALLIAALKQIFRMGIS